MPATSRLNSTAFVFTMALHLVVFMLTRNLPWITLSPHKERSLSQIVLVQVMPPSPAKVPATAQALSDTRHPLPVKPLTPTNSAPPRVRPSTAVKHATRMAAPPPPTPQEWAFAAQYTHKNSKGYRYSWGQQVRSMMGTAVEGPDQGFVRFRVEIAPDGSLTQLDILWTTSALAEQLARKALETMPPLPPTPTGKPLIFEKTISFSPYASDGPPSYKDDCLPDTPAFRNPFAWDGQSAPTHAIPPKTEQLDPQALEECLRQLPQDTLEAEMARDQRAMERWGWRK